MATKFLYIDDEGEDKVSESISPLLSEDLTVEHQRPFGWDKQIDELTDQGRLNNYDGLLLDLKLEFPIEGQPLKYYGSDLAQAIRTKAKQGSIKDLPIILCTSNTNLQDYFDDTSSDLFDLKLDKEKDLSKSDTPLKMKCFAEAYATVREGSSFDNIFGDIESNSLPIFKQEYDGKKTIHGKVSLVFNEVIEKPGILLDETLLAIRLGVDKEKSNDWKVLINEKLADYKFKGMFEDCYPRWKQGNLLNWWKAEFKNALKNYPASQRVAKLKEKFELNDLIPLEKPEKHRYDTFWYKCRLSDTPLEVVDGLPTIELPKYVWQEASYISNNYLWSQERNRAEVNKLIDEFGKKQFSKIIEKTNGL